MSEPVRTFACGDCGRPIRDDPARPPCTACGGTKRLINLAIQSEVRPLVTVSGKHKQPGEKRPRTEFLIGWALRRAVGDMVKKVWRLDRANNQYFEHVETADGEVLKHQDHALKDHTDHGTAKFKAALGPKGRPPPPTKRSRGEG